MSRFCIPCRSWDMQCVQQCCLLEEFLSAACHYKWCAAKQRATISLDGVCHCLREEISYLEAGGELSKFTVLGKPARAYHSLCVLLCLRNPSIQALSSSFKERIFKNLFSTKNHKQTNKQTPKHPKKTPSQNKQTKNPGAFGFCSLLHCILSRVYPRLYRRAIMCKETNWMKLAWNAIMRSRSCNMQEICRKVTQKKDAPENLRVFWCGKKRPIFCTLLFSRPVRFQKTENLLLGKP